MRPRLFAAALFFATPASAQDQASPAYGGAQFLPECKPADMKAHAAALQSGRRPECRPVTTPATNESVPLPPPATALNRAVSGNQVTVWRPRTGQSAPKFIRNWHAVDPIVQGRAVADDIEHTKSIATGAIEIGTWTAGLYSAWLESSRVLKARGDRDAIARERLAALPAGSAILISMRRAGSQNSGWAAQNGQWSFEGPAREYDVLANPPGASTREAVEAALVKPNLEDESWEPVDVAVYKKMPHGIVSKSLDANDHRFLRSDLSGATLATQLDDQLELISGVAEAMPMRKAGYFLGGTTQQQTAPTQTANTSKARSDSSTDKPAKSDPLERLEPKFLASQSDQKSSAETPAKSAEPADNDGVDVDVDGADDDWWLTIQKGDYPVPDSDGPACPVCVSNADLRRAELDAALAFGSELASGTIQLERSVLTWDQKTLPSAIHGSPASAASRLPRERYDTPGTSVRETKK